MQLVTHPADVLYRVCDSTVRNDSLKGVIAQMSEVMYAADGCGLASPQVGLTNRIILVDPSAGASASELIAMVDPKVFWVSHELEEGTEGCLSLPGVSLSIVRPTACDVEYYDVMSSSMKTLRCVGLRSRIVQHEVDHLDGVTLIDKVGPLARRTALQDMKQVNR